MVTSGYLFFLFSTICELKLPQCYVDAGICVRFGEQLDDCGLEPLSPLLWYLFLLPIIRFLSA